MRNCIDASVHAPTLFTLRLSLTSHFMDWLFNFSEVFPLRWNGKSFPFEKLILCELPLLAVSSGRTFFKSALFMELRSACTVSNLLPFSLSFSLFNPIIFLLKILVQLHKRKLPTNKMAFYNVLQHKATLLAASVFNGQFMCVHASPGNVTTFQIYGLLTCHMQVSTKLEMVKFPFACRLKRYFRLLE